MKSQIQPIWITLEAFVEDGRTRIVRGQFPKGDLDKDQKLKIAERMKVIRERAKVARTQGTSFKIIDGFGV